MPLTDTERENIREAEVLRNDIRKELRFPEPESRLSSFQQQILLLLLGSLLTTGVGGFLTYWWKQRDWTNQQAYLLKERALDKKYAVIEKTFKAVATTTSASEDVLATYYNENWTSKEIDERRTNWDKTSRNWRIESKVLSQELAVNFANSDIQSTFQQIVRKRRELGVSITNLLTEKRTAKSDDAVEKEVQKDNSIAVDIVNLLYRCGGLMTSETR